MEGQIFWPFWIPKTLKIPPNGYWSAHMYWPPLHANHESQAISYKTPLEEAWNAVVLCQVKDLGISDIVWPMVKVRRPAAETIAPSMGAKMADHVEWLRCIQHAVGSSQGSTGKICLRRIKSWPGTVFLVHPPLFVIFVISVARTFKMLFVCEDIVKILCFKKIRPFPILFGKMRLTMRFVSFPPQ